MKCRAAALALALFGCATPPPAEPPKPPEPPRIYSVAAALAIGERELVGELASARFVVLGETHDNPEHHRLQARLLERLVLAARQPAVAFEMLRIDQQPALDEVLAGGDVSAQELRAAVSWDESGWPPFALYAAVFEEALAADLPIVGADLSKADRAALRGGQPELIAELGLGAPLPAAEQRALERDIEASHCGHVTAEMLPAMVRVQRARDARLAQSLLGASGGEGRPALLIAGAEHARLDRGVPRALSRLAPGADVAAVAFVELSRPAAASGSVLALADRTALEARYGGPPPFDFVWLTEPEPREDPCVEFEEALRKMGR